jgi:hypothetical protein
MDQGWPVTAEERADGGVAFGGAEFKGVEGETLSELSFEVKGYCGPGAPRFNVSTTTDSTYFFGCVHGDTTDLADGWKRVTFTGDEVGVPAGAFGSTISGVDVVMDEEGDTLLRNISVNGVSINKF